MHEGEGALAEVRRGSALVEKRGERCHGAEDDAPRGNLELGEDLGEETDDLSLGRGPLVAHELDAELRELARLALERRLLADDGCGVAEADRQLVRADARGDEAGDGQREVGTEHEEAAVAVKELEGRALDAPAALEGAPLLEERGLDRKVAVGGEALAYGG